MAEGGSLRHSAVRGGAYLIGRQIVAVALKLIGVMLITRVLGPTKYGSFVAASNVYQYALLIGQAGVGIYLLRYPGDLPERAIRTAYSLLAITALVLTVGLFTSRDLVMAWSGVAGYPEVMTVVALALPFQLLSIPAMTFLERDLNYRDVATIEIGGDVAYYALAAPLALMGYGAIALGWALLVQKAIFFGLGLYLSRTRPRFGMDRETVVEVVRYAATFSFANWIWQLRMLVNPMIAGPVVGAYGVGLIGMTIGILELLSLAKTVAWRLSVSVLGRIQDDHVRLRKAVTEGMPLQTLVVGAMLLGFGWLGGLVVPVVFGARWAPVMDYYPYIAVSYLSVATFNVHSAVMSVIDRNMKLAIYHIVHIIVFAATAWFAVRGVGAVGYGYAELATIPVYFVMHLVLAREIGSPRYGLTALWWAATVIGLFWRQIGLWAIVVPFIALAMPPSIRAIRGYIGLLRKPKAAAEVAVANEDIEVATAGAVP